MKSLAHFHRATRIRSLLFAIGGTFLLQCPASAANLSLKILPCFNGAPLAFDAVTNVTAARQTISITRLDFLLSDIALRSTNGTWIKRTNWFAFINGREGRTSIQLDNVSPASYDRIRFLVGLSPQINHQDPAVFPATHPLNPEGNGLHWSWAGGYVFFALEGRWLRPNGAQSGYSYHIATDAKLMAVEFPIALDLSSDREIDLALNLEQLFSRPQRLILADESSGTHSRTNDSLAGQLRASVESAFAVRDVRETARTSSISDTPKSRIEIAPNATPYRLTISRFFPRPALPLDNPLTEEGIALGRELFFDPLLSIDKSQSCASCHVSQKAFTDSKTTSSGAEGRVGTRNAMALLNLAWKSAFFWDGRAPSLREQVLQPIQNPIEMHESISNVVVKLGRTTNYPVAFQRAFGTGEISADRIARALEQFLLVQVSHHSKFDRVLNGEATFSAEEQRGFELFHTEYDPRRQQFGADCFHCHGGPLFQSQSFANNGLDAKFTDLGRYDVTRKEGDKGKFAVPSLRNVAVTAPYMHDGRFATLEEVIEHYTTGVKRSSTLDPNLAKHPDGGVPLSPSDKRALAAFLKTLTDQEFLPPTLAKVQN